MIPRDILEALRLTRDLQHPLFRHNYAMGGSPTMGGFDPTSYYTPRMPSGAIALSTPMHVEQPDPQNQMAQAPMPRPTTQTGQSYTWNPLYPAAGSGVNIPHPPPPVGPKGLLGYAGAQQTLGGSPSYDWPLPYSPMGGGQWGGGQWGGGLDSGTGLKTGPSMNGRASGGAVWNKPRPKSLGKPKHLSAKQKSSAKAAAKAAGRPYPNLIDNMRAAKGK